MVKINVKKLSEKVLFWVFLSFLIYIIFELVHKLFGGSLGFEEMVIALLIANLGYSFYLKGSISSLDSKISGHIGWHKGKDSK